MAKTKAAKGKSRFGAGAKPKPAAKPQGGGKPAATPAPNKQQVAAMVADYLNKVSPGTLTELAPSYAKPTEPKKVDPFFAPDDLQAINDFTTTYATNLANIDAGLGGLDTDTKYQKTQNNSAAQQQSASATDAMIARGLFRSSVKDAALYDIEAQRSLANKFLDDKLTAATLNAGTQKKILGDSKKRFDDAMLAKQVQNAQSVNDPAAAAWADAMASYNSLVTQNLPKPSTPTTPATPAAPAGGAGAPSAVGGTAKPTGPNTASGTGSVPGAGGTAKPTGPNTASGTGSTSGRKRYYWPDGKMHSRPYRGR